MPLLVVALITHVLYRAMTKGTEWGSDTSRRAWDASMASSQRLGDRIRQRMADKLAEWDADPGARGYAAFTTRAVGKTARGLGKVGLWSLFKGARAAGAVSRAVGGGVIATGGLLGALAQATREGARNGADWWDRRAKRRTPRAEAAAERLRRWGNTLPGELTPESEDPLDPEPEFEPRSEPPTGPPSAAPTEERVRIRDSPLDIGEPASTTTPRTNSRPQPESGTTENPEQAFNEFMEELRRIDEARRREAREKAQRREELKRQREAAEQRMREDEARRRRDQAYQAGEATVESPATSRTGETSTAGPTPVGSRTAGAPAIASAATGVLDRPGQPATEGEPVTTAVATTSPTNGVAPIASPADGLMYEQALEFLKTQAERAGTLATMAENIHSLQVSLREAAETMKLDHEAAESALARFNVIAPNVGPVTEQLTSVAGDPAPDAALATLFMALEAVIAGCRADQADLQNRFGLGWEVVKKENIDGQFLNG